MHRDVNQSSIEKYGDAVTTYVTGVINPGESFVLKNGSWGDWSGVVEEGKAQGVRIGAQSEDNQSEGAPEQEGVLIPYYDYDNLSLKAFADDAVEEEPVPEEKTEPRTDDTKPEEETNPHSDDRKPEADKTQNAGSQQAKSDGAKTARTNARAKAKTLPRTSDPLSLASLAGALALGLGSLVAGIHTRRHGR